MSELTNFEKVVEFNVANGVTVVKKFEELPYDAWNLTIKLIKEEFGELMAEVNFHEDNTAIHLTHVEMEKVLKEASDLLYVVYGLFHRLGFDANAVFNVVHKSNMSKLGPDGKPVLREDGKVIKGPNFVPADLSDFIIAQRMNVEKVSTVAVTDVLQPIRDAIESSVAAQNETPAPKKPWWKRLLAFL